MSNIIATNRKAKHDYFIDTTMEAGLILLGWEVKALRSAQCSIGEAYIVVKDNHVTLVGATFTPLNVVGKYEKADPTRSRQLLLNKKEIQELAGHCSQKTQTAVPLEMYWVKGRAKIRIGLSTGKHKHDKRAAIKQRDIARDMKRES